jgi:signal transduction histidine kinase
MMRGRDLTFPADKGDVVLRVVVATDKAALEQAVDAFAGDVTPSLLLLAVVLLTASWLQVHLGLSPLEAVRRGIAAVRSGGTQRLDGMYPDEVTPLVQETNELLDAQEQTIARARARAADLAHGLKTPLTVLVGDARRLRDAGQHEIAAEIDGLAQTMQRHIDHELARARIGGRVVGRGASTSARESVSQVVKALQRTPRGEGLSWDIDVPADVILPMDATNAAELFGNLLENAMKWAASKISVASARGSGARIVVTDDGPGVDEKALPNLGQRGLRLDMRVQGSGLGLAIVREIVTAHGGDVTFENRKPKGFAVTLTFP